MRAIVACVLSFVVAFVLGVFLVPRTAPTHQPEPSKLQAQDAPHVEALPALPSLPAARIDGPNQYEEAWRLLKGRQYRAAESAFLEILMRHPHDRKAIDGLIAARRLRANQDPQRLQEDAAQYRRAIVEGRGTEETSAPREMELLAEASLSAAAEIRAEQNLRAGASSSAAIRAPLAPPHGVATQRRPPAATGDRVPKRALHGRPPQVSQIDIAVTVPSSRVSRPSMRPMAPPPAGASPRDTNSPGAPINRRQDPTVPPARESTEPPPDATQAGPTGGAASDAYLLGPGDQIEINVPFLAVTVTVKPDGVVALPLIGPIKAAGKTTAQLARDLTTMYSRVIDAPSITVFLRQPRATQ